MAIGTTKSPACGSRVEIPAYCDLWMRGARFGVVERVREAKTQSAFAGGAGDSRDYFGVRMDHPQVKRLAWVIADDCRFV